MHSFVMKMAVLEPNGGCFLSDFASTFMTFDGVTVKTDFSIGSDFTTLISKMGF